MMTRHVLSLLLACFLLLHAAVGEGQPAPPGYSVINYNSDNGLPQNSINDMVFDRNGFLWLSTEMGVVRFDGKNFREYNTENTPVLPTNRCALISTETSTGKVLIEPIFVSHQVFTINARYELERDTTLPDDPYQSHVWNNKIFYFERIYNKWGSQYPALFYRLDYDPWVFTVNERQAYVWKKGTAYYMDDGQAELKQLEEVNGRKIRWQFLLGDLFVCQDDHNQTFAYKAGMLQRQIDCSERLKRFLEDNESKMEGVPETPKSDPRQSAMGLDPEQTPVKIIRDTGHTFLVCQGNILVLGLRGNRLDYDTLVTGTAINDIDCLFYDEVAQIVYIGSATNGLYILQHHQFDRLAFHDHRYIINSLYAQAQLPDGRILTASGILSPDSARTVAFPRGRDRQSLLITEDDSVWFSAGDTLKKTDIHLHGVRNVEYLGSWVSAILETRNKDVVYATPHKLFLRRGETEITLLDHPGQLRNASIQTILEIAPGQLWIGTSKGIFAYDTGRRLLDTIRGETPDLARASITHLYASGDGSIWIGTYGQGFYRYDRGRFVRMPLDAAGNLATAHAFMEDSQGYFWIPTNKGLFRVAKADLDDYAEGKKDRVFYYYLDKSLGLASNEFNGCCTPCGIVTREGLFSLPSLDGLIQFDPDSVRINIPNKPIFLDRVLADGREVPVPDPFVQPQDSAYLVFSISSPYFGNPANLHLEYSIAELDDKWRPVDKDGQLILTGLTKGKYTLTIRKQEGYKRYAYKTIRLTILPYYYQTTWFCCIVVGLALGAFFLLFRVRYNIQVRKAEELEEKVAERTRELSESNSVKETIISIILHDLRSPLRFLHMMTKQVHERFRFMPEAELSKSLLEFRNASSLLYNFTQDFLLWTNTQKEGFHISRERIVLREIIREIISLYKVAADMHTNTLVNEVSRDIVCYADANILKLIIRNLVDNANKQMSGGRITVTAVQTPAYTQVVIMDTGPGMNNALIEKILRGVPGSFDLNQGWGYRIILELLGRIGGEIAIDNTQARQNKIIIRI